ncbi:MAG: hypothetical protein JWO88_259, partial [Frankiales bacterium]|nr:hypothetical protein [Frankiales bacterium]
MARDRDRSDGSGKPADDSEQETERQHENARTPPLDPVCPHGELSSTAVARAATAVPGSRESAMPKGCTTARTTTVTSLSMLETSTCAPRGATALAAADTDAGSSPRAAARAPVRAASTQRSSAATHATTQTAAAR